MRHPSNNGSQSGEKRAARWRRSSCVKRTDSMCWCWRCRGGGPVAFEVARPWMPPGHFPRAKSASPATRIRGRRDRLWRRARAERRRHLRLPRSATAIEADVRKSRRSSSARTRVSPRRTAHESARPHRHPGRRRSGHWFHHESRRLGGQAAPAGARHRRGPRWGAGHVAEFAQRHRRDRLRPHSRAVSQVLGLWYHETMDGEGLRSLLRQHADRLHAEGHRVMHEPVMGGDHCRQRSWPFSGLGALYQAIAGRRHHRQFPPPGQLIDVGGHRLHVICQREWPSRGAARGRYRRVIAQLGIGRARDREVHACLCVPSRGPCMERRRVMSEDLRADRRRALDGACAGRSWRTIRARGPLFRQFRDSRVRCPPSRSGSWPRPRRSAH